MRAALMGSLFLFVTLIAGCISDNEALDPAADEARVPHIGALLGPHGAQAIDMEPLFWDGPTLVADGDEEHRFTFTYERVRDYAGVSDLEVGIQWFHAGRHFDAPGQNDLQLTVIGPDGTIQKDITSGTLDDMGWRDIDPTRSINPIYGRLVLIEEPQAGDYTAIVRAVDGTTSYHGVVQLEERPSATGPKRDLLPDIAMLPPTDLMLDHPGYLGLVDPDPEAAGRPGCHPEEYAEDPSTTRCLRFSLWLANVGEGPLVIQMRDDDRPNSLVAERPIQQLVLQTDGTLRERDAGYGLYHASHIHLHIRDTVEFVIHDFDLETRTVGEAVTSQQKIGWNPGNLGLVGLGLPYTAAAYAVCGDPAYDLPETCIELDSSWVDEYSYDLFHQYIDITGLDDGVYLLASNANIKQDMEESTDANNAAYTIFRLTGNDVEELGRLGPGGILTDDMPHPHDGDPLTMGIVPDTEHDPADA